MEDVISISDIYTNDARIDMKLAPAGIAIKDVSSGQVLTINGDEIVSIELFRGTRRVTLRVHTASDIHSFANIEETLVEKLKDISYKWYNQIVYFKELNIYTPTSGVLEVHDTRVEFANDKTIFDFPVAKIESVYESKSDLTFSFQGMQNGVSEITFSTQNKNIAKHLRESSAQKNELVTFESVQTVFPRGKMNYVFYDEYIRIVGQTHTHKLFYTDVREIYLLDRETSDKYCTVRIEPLRQGNTKYDFLVLSFDGLEVECTVKDKSYKGLLSEVFAQLLSDLADIRIERGKNALKCVSKAYEGMMYMLENSLLFLPKAILIVVDDITLVEFSRINFSRLASKTFDMKVIVDGVQHHFDGLPKEEFNNLEQFLSNNGVKVRSEVIADRASEQEDDENEDDDGEVDLETTSSE